MADNVETAKVVIGAADVPEFHASGVQIASTGVDLMIIFTRPTVRSMAEPGPPSAQAITAVSLSRGAAADLQAVLGDVLAQLDAEFGPSSTPFLRQRAKAKESAN